MSAPDPAPLNKAVLLLRDMYACQDNDARGKLTLQLLQFETTLTAEQASFVGIELLKTTTEGPAVQAYGGVILKHALSKNLLRADSLPFWDLLAWYSNEPTLGNLLCSTLIELFVEYIIHIEGDRSQLVAKLINDICPEVDLAKNARHIHLLFAVVACFSSPDYERLPANQAAQLAKDFKPYFPRILKAVMQALSDLYAAAGGAQQPVAGTAHEMEDAVMIVGYLGTQVPGDVWAAVGLEEAIQTLLQWPPARKVSIAATTMLLRSASRLDAEQENRVKHLLVSLLSFVEQCVETSALTTIDELLDMLQTLPKPLVRSISGALCYPLLCILRIPSLMFANIACSLLLQLDESAFASVNVQEFYAAFRRLLPKNLFHPDSGTVPEGVALSQQQLGFAGLYDQMFSEVRSRAGKIVSLLAKLNPPAANQYVLTLLSDLCSPQGTATDERTVAGFVTQRSATFVSWECTQFLMSYLSDAFPLCSDCVAQCIQALLQRQPTDAVLQPLYFNMLSYFWTCANVNELNIWGGTLDILFTCVEEKVRDTRDPDVGAARRRALTLLITVSTEHASKLVPLVPALVKRIEALLFNTRSGTEKSLLYEALASFLTCLPVEDADGYLASLLKPVLMILDQHISSMDENLFIQTVVAQAEPDRARREEVRQALTVLSAVLRRCRATPYVSQLLTQLSPLVLRAMHLLHSVTAQKLPDGFKAILEMDDQMREQQLPGAKRRSDLSRNAVIDARSFLQSVRYNLYEIFGTLGERLPVTEMVEVLRHLGPATEDAPVHVIRTLTERCLIPMTQSHEELLLHGLAVIDMFFVKRSAVVQEARTARVAAAAPAATAGAGGDGGGGRGSKGPKQQGGKGANQNDDVIDAKQWYHYTKTVMAFIRGRVMDTNLWQRGTEYLWGVCQIMTHIFESNADFKDSSRFFQSLLDLKTEPGCAPGIEEALAQCQLIIYTGLVQYAIFPDRMPITPQDRENYVYHLAVPYIDRFPYFSQALVNAGVEAAKVEELHAYLMLCNGAYARKQKMKEFLLKYPGA